MADKSKSVKQLAAPDAELTAPQKAVLAQAKTNTKTNGKHIEAARAARLAAAKKAKG